MSEILFRGKRLDNGEWVSGRNIFEMKDKRVYIAPSGVPVSMLCCDSSDVMAMMPKVEVDFETVGQYIGLTDKNGTKIFEGDRCRVSRPCVLAYGKITFQNGCFWFVDDGPGGMLRLCDAKINGFEVEVIGNVHDNPELLRKDGADNE